VKRILVIPIMFLYLLAVSGVMIHLHYCGSTLESFTFYTKTDGCGEGECGDESKKSDDCCKDKVIASKVSVDQHFSDGLKLKQSPIEDFPAVVPVLYSVISSQFIPACSYKTTGNQSNAPPGLWQHIPLYKLHSNFTYYG